VLVVKVAQFEAEKERLSRELDTAVSQQNANKEDLHEQLESLAAERDALIQKYDSLVDEHRTSMQELSEAQQRLIDSQAAQQPLQARHDELTQQLAAVQAETSTQLNDLESKLAAALRHATQADAALEEASQAQRILEDELTRARQELQRQVDDLTTSHPSTEDMDELRASYTEQLIQAQSHLEEAKARAQDAAQKLDESNRLRMTLETQRREDQDRHLSSYGELETAHRTAQQELAAHCARLEEAQSVTAQQRLDLENLNQVVMRLSSESNNLRSSHQDLQNQLTQKCVILPAQSSLWITLIISRNDLFIATQNQLRQLQDSFEQTAQAQDQANVDLEERDRQLASVRVAIEEKAALEETLADLKAQYDDQIARAQQMLQDIEANDDHLLRYVLTMQGSINVADHIFQAEEREGYFWTEGRVSYPEERKVADQAGSRSRSRSSTASTHAYDVWNSPTTAALRSHHIIQTSSQAFKSVWSRIESHHVSPSYACERSTVIISFENTWAVDCYDIIASNKNSGTFFHISWSVLNRGQEAATATWLWRVRQCPSTSVYSRQ
jgi:chromosome segregation ATPase